MPISNLITASGSSSSHRPGLRPRYSSAQKSRQSLPARRKVFTWSSPILRLRVTSSWPAVSPSAKCFIPARRALTSNPTARAVASAGLSPITPAIAPTPPFVIRMGTGGSYRRLRHAWRAALTLGPRRSRQGTIWRARFGAQRRPMDGMKHEPGKPIRTGPTGTPSTWWRSTPATTCPSKDCIHISGPN